MYPKKSYHEQKHILLVFALFIVLFLVTGSRSSFNFKLLYFFVLLAFLDEKCHFDGFFHTIIYGMLLCGFGAILSNPNTTKGLVTCWSTYVGFRMVAWIFEDIAQKHRTIAKREEEIRQLNQRHQASVIQSDSPEGTTPLSPLTTPESRSDKIIPFKK